MKILTYKIILIISLFLIFSNFSIFGQNAKINPLQVKSSTLFEDLLNFKSENSKVTNENLVEQANILLRQKGLNFVFAFDQNICQKVLELQEKQKDKLKPIKLSATLKSVDGEGTKIILPEISFDKSECGRCFVQMPLFEFSGKEFVTSIQSSNIKFYTPADYLFNEVILVDAKNFSSIIHKWQVPFRSNPIGISDDGKLLYLELPDKELNNLCLIIDEEGGFQFYAKSELDLSIKSPVLKDIPKDLTAPNTTFIKFTKEKNIQVLKYNTSCQ